MNSAVAISEGVLAGKSSFRRPEFQADSPSIETGLCPDANGGIPGGSRDGGSVGAGAETADAVLVAVEDEYAVSLESVPDADAVVPVAREQQTTRDGEVHAVDGEEHSVLLVHRHLAIRAQVEEATARIVAPRSERVPVRVESQVRVA